MAGKPRKRRRESQGFDRRTSAPFVDYSDHPRVMRVFRSFSDNTWMNGLLERFWEEFGAKVDLPSANAEKLTLLGGGEMGYALTNAGVLDNFPVSQAEQAVRQKLGVEFRLPRAAKVGGLIVRKMRNSPELAIALDDVRLPQERRIAASVISQKAGYELGWRTIDQVCIGVANLASSSIALASDELCADIATRNLPEIIELEPGEISTNYSRLH